MNIIITMAGLGSRFKEAGYKLPKYMIEVNNITLFEYSMLSLTDYNKHVNKYFFIVRKEDNSTEFISNLCNKLGINKFEIIEINELTDGQATTVMMVKSYINESEPILIYNIDTYVESGELLYDDIVGDGYIPCFLGEGDHWSFVKLNNLGLAVDVREKERISDNCTLGAYYFSSFLMYENLYNAYYLDVNNLVKNEKYIAPLYNQLILDSKKVYISIINKSKIHALGTPDEVESFKKII